MHRKPFGAAALVIAGALAAGCVESVAQESPKPLAPQKDPAPAPAQPPAPAPAPAAQDEPHGRRPIDEGAIRALGEEVARLRAELARMQAEKDAAAKAPASPFIRGGEPAAAAPATPEPSPAATPEPAREEPVAQTDPAPAERVIERERIIEREVPVYVEREPEVVYVDRPPTVGVEEVVYETVIYRDVSCHQVVPCGHVHSVGCGHHYYGCACHPWYYDLDGGLDITFVWYDVDHDRRPCGAPRGRYRAGYRDGYRDGFRDGDDHDVHHVARPFRERSPSAPDRRDGYAERGPALPLSRSDDDGRRPSRGPERPAAPVVRGDAPSRAPSSPSMPRGEAPAAPPRDPAPVARGPADDSPARGPSGGGRESRDRDRDGDADARSRRPRAPLSDVGPVQPSEPVQPPVVTRVPDPPRNRPPLREDGGARRDPGEGRNRRNDPPVTRPSNPGQGQGDGRREPPRQPRDDAPRDRRRHHAPGESE